MKFWIKIISIVLAAMLALGLMAGCNFVREETEWDRVMAEMIEEIDFDADSSYTGELVVARNAESGEVKNLTAFIESFNKKYPNIKVTQREIPSSVYGETLKKENSAADNSGDYSDMFDVFWTAENDMPVYAVLEMLVPLEYLDEADENFSTDGLVENMVKDSSSEGHLFVMPRDYNQIVMYYNADILAEAGVEEPPTDRALTAEEFRAMLVRIREHFPLESGVWPLDAYWNWESLFWAYLKSFGGELLVSDSSGALSSNLASEESYAAYKYLKELNTDTLTGAAGQTAPGQFSAGNAAFGFHSRAVLTGMLDADMVDNVGVAPLPQFGDTYTIGAGCSGYGMYRYAPHKTEAWLFLKHIVSEEGQEAFGRTGNGIPVLQSQLEDPNAGWRSFTHENLLADFDSEVYVFAKDTAATSTRDYKDLIRTDQVGDIKDEFESSVQYVLNYTDSQNYLADSSNRKSMYYYLELADKRIDRVLAR